MAERPSRRADRHAQDRGGEQHQAEGQEAEVAVLMIHAEFRTVAGRSPADVAFSITDPSSSGTEARPNDSLEIGDAVR